MFFSGKCKLKRGGITTYPSGGLKFNNGRYRVLLIIWNTLVLACTAGMTKLYKHFGSIYSSDSYTPAISSLGRYPVEIHTCAHQNTHAAMLVVALCRIALMESGKCPILWMGPTDNDPTGSQTHKSIYSMTLITVQKL